MRGRQKKIIQSISILLTFYNISLKSPKKQLYFPFSQLFTADFDSNDSKSSHLTERFSKHAFLQQAEAHSFIS